MENNYNNILYENDYNELQKQYSFNKINGSLNQLSKSHITTESINIHIDSRDRHKNSRNIIEKYYYLTKNPITISNDIKNNNIIQIYCSDHNLKITDKIIIKNVHNPLIYLNHKDISFTHNQYYVKFNYSSSYIEYIIRIDKYEDQYINIIDISSKADNIGNIPKELLLGLHKIYYNIDLVDNHNNINIVEQYNTSYFYIKLPIVYNETLQDNDFIVTINLLNIGGIHINKINSNYPIDNNNKDGYKNIYQIIDKDNFSIKVNSNASGNITRTSGGENVIIGKIKKTIIGYPNNNNYKIDIGTINNIKNINIISSIFPHSEYNIIKYPLDRANNKLYFNILYDANYTYEINVSEGYYTITTLIDTITNIILKLQRIDYGQNEIVDEYVEKKNLYLYPVISYNSYQDIISFKIFNKIKIINGISKIDNDLNNPNIMRINHSNHNLSINDTIIISNALGTNKIPASIINKEHIIIKIIDNYNYLILLDDYVEDLEIDTTNGGPNTIITYPLRFRFDFSKSDTLGYILGFRNSGEKKSITHYHTEISNTTPYYNEVKYNNNDIIKMQNNRINLYDKNYIFLSCNLFYNSNSESVNIKINNSNYIILAKIHLTNLGSYVYNNHINLLNKLDYIITNINEIEFIFHDKDYNLYEFGNKDHSFILNFIIEKIEDKHTNINTNTGLSSVDSSLQRVTVVE